MMLGGLLRWQGYVSSIMRERGHQSILLLSMSIVGLTIWTHCLYRSEKMEYWQFHTVQTKRYPFLVQSFGISAWRTYRGCVCRCSYTHIYVINIWPILCFKRRKIPENNQPIISELTPWKASTTQSHGRHRGTPASDSPEALLKNACSWPHRPTESEISGVESQKLVNTSEEFGAHSSLTTTDISNDSTLWIIYYIFSTSVKKESEDHYMKSYIPNYNWLERISFMKWRLSGVRRENELWNKIFYKNLPASYPSSNLVASSKCDNSLEFLGYYSERMKTF